MNEQEKAISQLCLAMQCYCNDLRVDHNFPADSYNLECIEDCIEKIHRIVNPDFDKTFNSVTEEQDAPRIYGACTVSHLCDWIDALSCNSDDKEQ